MNARIDCPEDLLVLRRRRSLTAAEERTLADHGEDVQSLPDVAVAGSAVEPLPPVDDADAALAARWVAGALAPRVVPGRSNARSPRPPGVGQRRWLATAAALLLTAGVAAAAAWQRISSPPPAAPAVDSAREPAARARGRRSARVAAPAEALPAAPEQPAPEEPVAPPPAAAARRPATLAHPAPQPAHPIAKQREARKVRGDPAATTAANLFAAANRARRERRFADAAQLYQTLHRSFAASEEATQSLLSLADMLLAQGQADAALARFDAYLASAAPVLAEEALVGRARALARIEGRSADERAAWRELLDRYPRSTYGWRARQRLVDLDAHCRLMMRARR